MQRIGLNTTKSTLNNMSSRAVVLWTLALRSFKSYIDYRNTLVGISFLEQYLNYGDDDGWDSTGCQV